MATKIGNLSLAKFHLVVLTELLKFWLRFGKEASKRIQVAFVDMFTTMFMYRQCGLLGL
jgi:hypothetical protein